METPYQIWTILVIIGAACTFYSWVMRDEDNYTDIITGLIGTILLLISGWLFFSGIKAEEIIFVSDYIGWLFIGIGLIQALITIVKAMDLMGVRFNKNDN